MIFERIFIEKKDPLNWYLYIYIYNIIINYKLHI